MQLFKYYDLVTHQIRMADYKLMQETEWLQLSIATKQTKSCFVKWILVIKSFLH